MGEGLTNNLKNFFLEKRYTSLEKNEIISKKPKKGGMSVNSYLESLEWSFVQESEFAQYKEDLDDRHLHERRNKTRNSSLFTNLFVKNLQERYFKTVAVKFEELTELNSFTESYVLKSNTVDRSCLYHSFASSSLALENGKQVGCLPSECTHL